MSVCEEWKKTWPFVSSVPDNPYSFRCNVCDKKLSSGHQGAADVKDHDAIYPKSPEIGKATRHPAQTLLSCS